jgi:hypothetical protein
MDIATRVTFANVPSLRWRTIVPTEKSKGRNPLGDENVSKRTSFDADLRRLFSWRGQYDTYGASDMVAKETKTKEREQKSEFCSRFGSSLVSRNQGRHGRSGMPEGYATNSGCGGFD